MGNKAKCPFCRKKIEIGIIYCNKCGKKLPDDWPDGSSKEPQKDEKPKYCPKCRTFAFMDDGVVTPPLYCMTCGCDFSKLSPLTMEELNFKNSSKSDSDNDSEIALRCSKCGRDVIPGNKFCDGCGCNFNIYPPVGGKSANSTPPPTVEYCKVCGKNIVKHRGDICDSCAKKIDEPTYYCMKCHMNVVAKKGDICSACISLSREPEKPIEQEKPKVKPSTVKKEEKSVDMKGKGGDGFSQVTGI